MMLERERSLSCWMQKEHRADVVAFLSSVRKVQVANVAPPSAFVAALLVVDDGVKEQN